MVHEYKPEDGDVETILWFGSYKDKRIEQCPSSYLRYVVKNFQDEDLVAAAENELSIRDDNSSHFED